MASKDISKGKMEPKTKVPSRKYGAHSGLKFKFNIEKDAISKSVTVGTRTERKLPPREDEAHSGTKTNLEKDIIKKSTTFESKTEKEKLSPQKDKGHTEPKLNLNLLRDVIRKESNFESQIEKGKLPPRKYGAHSGLKFNFDKGVVPKSPTIKRRTEKEKGNVTTVGTITKRIVQNQTQKEVHTTSGERMYVSTLEDVKISRKSESIHNPTLMKNAQADSGIPVENTNSWSYSVTSLRDLQPQQQSSKIPISYAHCTLKSREITSNVVNLSPLNNRKISKGGPPLTEEPMITTPRKKYGFHAGLRFCYKKDATTPVDTVFNKSPTLTKHNCFENEKRDPVF